MYPLSDKDLDRLSREAAEQFDIEPAASGWEQLEEKLDKALPVYKKKDRKRILWLLFLLALLSGGGLTWVIMDNADILPNGQQNLSRSATPSQEGSTTDDNSITNQNTNSTRSKDQENISNIPENTEQGTAHMPAERSQQPSASASADKTVQPSANNAETRITQGTRGKTLDSRTGDRQTSSKDVAIKQGGHRSTDQLIGNKEISAKSVINKDHVQDVAASESESYESRLSPSYLFGTLRQPFSTPDLAANLKPAPVAQDKEGPTREKAGADKAKTSGKRSPFSFGLQTGFDISMIHASTVRSPGYDLGIVASYQVSKRFSLNTGFIVTKKNYEAAGSDYHPPKQYWTNYVKLDKLEGDCFMWEIPLNVRYNVNLNENKLWFVNAGLSNYIMRRQNYTYYYTYNNTPTVGDWSYGSQANYWFGILNLSGGYERRLSQTLSLQAEPFLKIPLTGVGFGKMDISSYGMYLTLKFNPLKKNHQTTSGSKTH